MWNEKRSKFSDNKSNLNGESRFREYDLFKYWFRAVEKYAPWVNNIYLVTDRQTPKWLNKDHPKLKLVNHDEYIPNEYLPTFNSNVIELNMHRIKELSENFVLFSDDVFLNDYVHPDDFFKNNLPVESGIIYPIFPESEFDNIRLNNVAIINKYFSKRLVTKRNFSKFYNLMYGTSLIKQIINSPYNRFPGFEDKHLTTAHKKSTFEVVWEKQKDTLVNTSKHKFRELSDVNHWLVKYWNICEGNFYPQNSRFGAFFWVREYKSVIEDLKASKHKVICVNDEDEVEGLMTVKDSLIKSFEEKYPNKSKFEL
ncbi:capsule biosynthesis protein CapG [Latilactobacillus curvatus]|uniref:capsule biosynthesis protein CapG n=1 Tax=Latilactobacillus curvatus TaxID=28038 RepID=UPI0021A7F106|nr:capsule biosynthesis protein CapG [Latilactobacillus curvatus]MCT3529538.1 capsule biosynthesis protein CapG [Latilactobacillus curvatus]